MSAPPEISLLELGNLARRLAERVLAGEINPGCVEGLLAARARTICYPENQHAQLQEALAEYYKHTGAKR